VRRSETDRAALEDMLRHAGFVRDDTKAGRAALDDDRTLRSVLYALAIVGEAANRLSPELCDLHPEVPWRRIINLRNILVHGYHRIELDRVWQAVQLPSLEEQRAILEEVPE
jgi:uncharacterized protein with HEPN domain